MTPVSPEGTPGSIGAGFAQLRSMSAKPTPMPGDVIAGCEILRLLGEGGRGLVYEVRDPAGEARALKVLRPSLAADPRHVADFERGRSALQRTYSE